ncbi:18 kDa seed maturation protein [Cajanus cajan]|uniref:18 kDa seed maturation protein n=1 Tax=Cajanus cajan TaxID=3821 RepID=A0A151R1C0_CAJCA|nr:18 kDa seed maturation protein [Cajanus cajan]KYP36245.1 18 kDa seed maturation protein [Cajanus cajan]
MQAARKAVETIKETAANIGASAKSGFDKTKATLQEKGEMMSAHDQNEKDIAAHKKEEKIQEAEREKQQARQYNATTKQSALAGDMGQAHHSGPGTEPATIDTPGPGPTTETTTSNTTGPGPESTGPGTETATYNYENTLPPSTGPGPEAGTAMFPTGDYGLMGGSQSTVMPGHRHGHGHGIGLGHEPGQGLDHGPGPGHGGPNEDMMGPRAMETNSGLDTTAQTTIGDGSAPSSGPTLS